MPQEFMALHKAMTAYRERHTDARYACAVEAGKCQLQRITYANNGTSTVLPLSDWLAPADFILAVGPDGSL